MCARIDVFTDVCMQATGRAVLAEAQLAAACAREAALEARLEEAQARIGALEQASPMQPARPVHIGVRSLGSGFWIYARAAGSAACAHQNHAPRALRQRMHHICVGAGVLHIFLPHFGPQAYCVCDCTASLA